MPAAINVLTGEELSRRHATDLEDLSYALPNVAFDAIGTGKGIANFSIRGLGVSGSIPSIDPTAGVFVDGVYLGVNYGAVMDLLDLEAVEVLRGPQGLLFGRNVTGGAVLLRSRRPGGGYTSNSEVRVETGPDTRITGGVEGWFENGAPGGGAVGAESAWALAHGGRLSTRVSIAHRDASEVLGDNRGVLDAGDLLDASVAFSPSDALTLVLYGQNRIC